MNIHTRSLISGKERALKLIDNGFVQRRSATEVYEQIRKILIEAIRNNFVFSEEKFQVRPK